MSQEQEQLAASVIDAIRLIGAHYGLWFAHAVEHLGLDAALEAEKDAGDAATRLALHRLSPQPGANPFADWEPERLLALREALSKLWLGVDGVWFQAVEKRSGMDLAKRVNDACWTGFAPLEAERILAQAGQGHGGGLDALEQALKLRLHSSVNEVALERQDGDLILRVVSCRVQAARRRKGMDDYPCKSAGVTEYSYFARTVDPRIRTTCLACPPDPLPEGRYCSWRFSLNTD